MAEGPAVAVFPESPAPATFPVLELPADVVEVGLKELLKELVKSKEVDCDEMFELVVEIGPVV